MKHSWDSVKQVQGHVKALMGQCEQGQGHVKELMGQCEQGQCNNYTFQDHFKLTSDFGTARHVLSNKHMTNSRDCSP